jgi:integration host factor subunit alpha
MTKAEIVQAVYTNLGGFSKKEAADLVDLVFETMKETLGRGEKIKISGFGNFVLRDKRQRQGRNPQTGDPIVITERRVLNFKASQLLKQALNEGRSSLPAAAGPASAPHGSGHSSAQANGAGPGNGAGHGSGAMHASSSGGIGVGAGAGVIAASAKE